MSLLPKDLRYLQHVYLEAVYAAKAGDTAEVCPLIIESSSPSRS